MLRKRTVLKNEDVVELVHDMKTHIGKGNPYGLRHGRYHTRKEIYFHKNGTVSVIEGFTPLER